MHQALALARQQNNRPLQLRVAMSLYGLERRQKGVGDKRELQDAYAAFTEGHDEADLREARALLQEP